MKKGEWKRQVEEHVFDKERLRFMKFVKQDDKTGCWLWTGAHIKLKDGSQYPVFRFRSQSRQARRVAWVLYCDKDENNLPTMIFSTNTCTWKSRCVNPAHLKRKSIEGYYPKLVQEMLARLAPKIIVALRKVGTTDSADIVNKARYLADKLERLHLPALRRPRYRKKIQDDTGSHPDTSTS